MEYKSQEPQVRHRPTTSSRTAQDFGSNTANLEEMVAQETAPSFFDILGAFFDEMNGASAHEYDPAPVRGNAVLDGLTEDQVRPTCRGTAEGFLPGESRHKTVAKTVFGNLTDPEFDKPQGSWRERQDAMDAEVRKGGVEPDAKLMNDVFVAQIMADPEIMRTSAQFALDMANEYGPKDERKPELGARSDFLRGKKPEMKHLWPDQDTTGTKNLDYRGWGGLVGGLASKKGPPDELSQGLGANREKLAELVAKEEPYTLEESTYILRAMGQLRDVMKAEKGKDGCVKGWIDGFEPAKLGSEEYPIAPKNRIHEKGPVKGNRDDPPAHKASRGFGTRYLQPVGTLVHQGKAPYAVENRVEGEPASFDYLMGTSGTTLDMLNFFLSKGKSPDEAAQLMQGFYANWHVVAPDGNAHSESESMGTLLQYLYDANLQAPIMTPLHDAADVESMKAESPTGRKQFANALSPDAPGYLGRQPAKK